MVATEAQTTWLLEARFHRTGQRDEFVVVAYVACEGGADISIRNVDQSNTPRATRALLSNLKYIVLMSAPRPYERLRALDSPFWSFVDVGASWKRSTHRDKPTEVPEE